jgi:hypothetical protein
VVLAAPGRSLSATACVRMRLGGLPSRMTRPQLIPERNARARGHVAAAEFAVMQSETLDEATALVDAIADVARSILRRLRRQAPDRRETPIVLS